MLRIALPNKGRLAEDVASCLRRRRARGPRARASARSPPRWAASSRPSSSARQDIPEFVADGAADAGVTGWDLVSESGRELDVLLDLEFGRCRLVVAAREDSGIELAWSDVTDGTRVATCFPRLTAGVLREARAAGGVVPVSGAAEIAPHLGIADIVVDLTSTGSTLKMNGLREVATVLESSARLVAGKGNGAGGRARTAGGAEAGARLGAARARQALPDGQRAAGRLDAGARGAPRPERPDGDRHPERRRPSSRCTRWSPRRPIYRTIAALKALGCEGILVTRIERLMP